MTVDVNVIYVQSLEFVLAGSDTVKEKAQQYDLSNVGSQVNRSYSRPNARLIESTRCVRNPRRATWWV